MSVRPRIGPGRLWPRLCLAGALLASCQDAAPGGPSPFPVRMNEVVSDNDGTAIDEDGQTGDWIELVNMGDVPVDLAGFRLADGANASTLRGPLLGPGARALFFADDDRRGRGGHVGFRIAAAGERLTLRDPQGRIADQVDLPALALNEAFGRYPDGTGAFARCRFTTPMRENGAQCGPPPPPMRPATVSFQPYAWPPAPRAPQPVAITELSLAPSAFVELGNTTTIAANLDGLQLRIAETAPGLPWPGDSHGTTLPFATSVLARGAHVVLALDEATRALIARGEFVVTLFDAQGNVLDRLDGSAFPTAAGVTLVRVSDDATAMLEANFRYCRGPTPGMAQFTCDADVPRAHADRLRHLRTPADFAQLAEGGTEVGARAVKFLMDLQVPGSMYFLSAKDWPLHYTFVRERIYNQERLDRCDPVEQAAFLEGWQAFSQSEYYGLQRRFLLGTLVAWAGHDVRTIDFAPGDVITGPMMKQVFDAVAAHVSHANDLAIRVQAADQIERIRSVEGQVPIVDGEAPFRGVTHQVLSPGVAVGLLRFVPATELAQATLGPGTIVVTDDVPNDLPLVGGLVTETFQTPLAHVAILSRNRGTPDLALRNARQDPRLAPLLDTLVRFEVAGADFSVRPATAEEAQVFQQQQQPTGPRRLPALDLAGRNLGDLPAIGGKAAQMAELLQLAKRPIACAGGLPLPEMPFALPVVHGHEHFSRSGALGLYDEATKDPAFAADPRVRAAVLQRVRTAILAHPVEPSLLSAVTREISRRFGKRRVRLRSSSNTEDLPGFSGAGLYESVSAAIDDEERPIDAGLKTVWASLWSERAWDGRELAGIDHGAVAMGVLVHPAFLDERANGVAISRNITDPVDGGTYVFNAQAGEAPVTNPAPGVTSEVSLYTWYRADKLAYQSRSSLVPGPVISVAEADRLGCVMRTIHEHFKARLDPMNGNRWFAVDVEWKLLGPERRLLVKQARPYNFGASAASVPSDCREL